MRSFDQLPWTTPDAAPQRASAGRTYLGTRLGTRRRVRVVWPGTDAVRPTSFHQRFPDLDWGRACPGATSLAWALLFDATDDALLADDWGEDLAAEVISRLPRATFALPEVDLIDWLHLSRPPRGLAWVGGR